MKKTIAALCFAAALSCCVIPTYGRRPVRPPFLHPGDTVAIVATSYEPSDSLVAASCSLLRSWGYEPVIAPNITANPLPQYGDSTRHYAGDAAQRAEALKWALENESVKALLCARGGYGAIHLLDLIPRKTYRAHPKWLVGYSDVTTLHCALNASGVMSVHAQMCGSLARKTGPDEGGLKLRDLLAGEMPGYKIPANTYNSFGSAEGVLAGGNLITMCALLGTEYDPTSGKDVILFIEEVDESMHAIDRLFNMLLIRGRLRNIRGIVFGDFSGGSRDLPYESVEQMLYQYASKLGIPVCCGFPAGHGAVNMPLVLGGRVKLDVGPEGSSISFADP